MKIKIKVMERMSIRAFKTNLKASLFASSVYAFFNVDFLYLKSNFFLKAINICFEGIVGISAAFIKIP